MYSPLKLKQIFNKYSLKKDFILKNSISSKLKTLMLVNKRLYEFSLKVVDLF